MNIALRRLACLFSVSVVACVFVACDGDDEPPRAPENAGQSCTVRSDCYRDVAAGDEIVGEITCLVDRVPGGYCSHTCAADTDCCAAAGECRSGIAQVCSPLESAGEEYCLLSCEDADVAAAKAAGWTAVDASEYCTRYAGPAFGCRSSGGGSGNRRVCMPNG
jgi:hypothetical protein